MRDNNHMVFEIQMSQHLKLRIRDFSLGCTKADVIIAIILGTISGRWLEIGKTTFSILEGSFAHWNDIEIDSDSLRGKRDRK